MTDGLVSKRSFVLVLGLLTSLIAVSIDISLPAIPQLVDDLDTTMSLGQQVIGIFLVGIGIGQIPAGLLSDRLGRIPVLYAGISLFLVASIVAAVSHDIRVLLAARFVQGIGSSVGIVLTRAIVRDVASGKEAARLMSLLVMIFTAAPMLAPMLGAFLVTAWGWRAPFYALIVTGLLALVGIRFALEETHTPSNDQQVLRQLQQSLKAFISFRQSVFGVLLVMTTAVGFMVLISGSAGLIIEIYGYDVKYFGVIFALTGLAILAGSSLNRRILLYWPVIRAIYLGAFIVGVVGAQMLFIAWLGHASFWWIWANACVYMFGTGLIMANATAIALDPVPRGAGVASSVIGTMQSVAASSSAIIGGLLYDGTIANIAIVMGAAGLSVALLVFFRRAVLGTAPLIEHP